MKPVIFLLVFFLATLKSKAQEVTFLKLKQAFKYENNKKVPEFSGLCIKDGILYSVNDKKTEDLKNLNYEANKVKHNDLGKVYTKSSLINKNILLNNIYKDNMMKNNDEKLGSIDLSENNNDIKPKIKNLYSKEDINIKKEEIKYNVNKDNNIDKKQNGDNLKNLNDE